MIGIDFKNKLERKKGEKHRIEQQIEQCTKRAKVLQGRLIKVEKAQEIVKKVTTEVQQQIKFSVTKIISLALSSIYNDTYEFDLDFGTRGGRTTITPFFKKNGENYIIGQETGGGHLDIASLALRLSLWTLNKTRNTIILDEPFRFLDVTAQEKLGEMLKFLCDKLNLQIIMVTHISAEGLLNEASRVYEVIKTENVSEVRRVQ